MASRNSTLTFSPQCKIIRFLKNIIPAFFAGATITIFHKLFFSLVISALVNPILSTVDESTFILDTFLLCFGAGTLLYGLYCGWKLIQISVKQLSWLTLLLFTYAFYRFNNTTLFAFVKFKSSLLHNIPLLDTAFVLFPAWLIYISAFYFARKKIQHRIKIKKNIDGVIGFALDEPLHLNKENDKYGHLPFLLDIKENILATEHNTGSLSIAILGAWGTGKTTFLLGIERELREEPNVIYIKFNPWMVHEPKKITASFFKTMSSKLGYYDHSLKNDLWDYGKKLITAYNNSTLNSIKEFFHFGDGESPLEDQYDRIDESIRSIGKKVVVEIDDVDRLHSDEIIEVLRIIRNTANFGNTIFLVAFDRNYILKSIKESIVDNNQTFLDKIFQMEYLLPVNISTHSFENSFFAAIKPYLTPNHQVSLEAALNPRWFTAYREAFPILSQYFSTERDVKRLRNMFFLSYGRIKHEVYFPDFLYITILKALYPNVYNLIYYKKHKYLSPTGILPGDMPEISRDIHSIQYLGQTDNITNTILYLDLKEIGGQATLESEIRQAVLLVAEIFPIPNSAGTPSQRTLLMHEFSIVNFDHFDRYFDYSMLGRLKQTDFDKAMKLPMGSLKKEIVTWSANRATAFDLRKKLVNAKGFNVKETFEKLIRIIIFYADNVPEDNGYFNNYDNDDFDKKVGGLATSNNQIIEKIYHGKSEEYKTSISKILKENSTRSRMGFCQYYLLWLLKQQERQLIFSNEELHQFLIDAFYKAIKQATVFDDHIFNFYRYLILEFSDRSVFNEIVPIGKGIEISVRFADFILSKGFEPFLAFLVTDPERTGLFSVSKWSQIIFRSAELFELFLEEKKDDSEANLEFYQFYKQFTTAKKGITFEFKQLEVMKKN